MSDDHNWNTSDIAPGASVTHTFTTPGTVTYFCGYHAQMTGTVVVETAAATPPGTDTSPVAVGSDHEGSAGLLLVAFLGGLLVAGRLLRRMARA